MCISGKKRAQHWRVTDSVTHITIMVQTFAEQQLWLQTTTLVSAAEIF